MARWENQPARHDFLTCGTRVGLFNVSTCGPNGVHLRTNSHDVRGPVFKAMSTEST